MNLKRFRGETVREALERARGELGPDALVLSTQLVPARVSRGFVGGREVEVTAAIDRDVSEPRPARQEVRQPESQAVGSLAGRFEAAGFAAAVAREVTPAHLASALPGDARTESAA
jgi:flagellar biosynthesis GTPase FlhF